MKFFNKTNTFNAQKPSEDIIEIDSDCHTLSMTLTPLLHNEFLRNLMTRSSRQLYVPLIYDYFHSSGKYLDTVDLCKILSAQLARYHHIS